MYVIQDDILLESDYLHNKYKEMKSEMNTLLNSDIYPSVYVDYINKKLLYQYYSSSFFFNYLIIYFRFSENKLSLSLSDYIKGINTTPNSSYVQHSLYNATTGFRESKEGKVLAINNQSILLDDIVSLNQIIMKNNNRTQFLLYKFFIQSFFLLEEFMIEYSTVFQSVKFIIQQYQADNSVFFNCNNIILLLSIVKNLMNYCKFIDYFITTEKFQCDSNKLRNFLSELSTLHILPVEIEKQYNLKYV